MVYELVIDEVVILARITATRHFAWSGKIALRQDCLC